MRQREVSGWVMETNVYTMLTTLSRWVGYTFDDFDWGAIVTALPETDAGAADRWYEYPLLGTWPVTVSLAINHGAAPVEVRVSGAFDEVLAARIDTMLNLLAEVTPASEPDRDAYGGWRPP